MARTVSRNDGGSKPLPFPTWHAHASTALLLGGNLSGYRAARRMGLILIQTARETPCRYDPSALMGHRRFLVNLRTVWCRTQSETE